MAVDWVVTAFYVLDESFGGKRTHVVSSALLIGDRNSVAPRNEPEGLRERVMKRKSSLLV